MLVCAGGLPKIAGQGVKRDVLESCPLTEVCNQIFTGCDQRSRTLSLPQLRARFNYELGPITRADSTICT